MSVFPKSYPAFSECCRTGACCCPGTLFSEKLCFDSGEYYDKEYRLPKAPTKLGGGRYVWDEDRRIDGDIVNLHNRSEQGTSPSLSPRSMSPRTSPRSSRQRSGISPPQKLTEHSKEKTMAVVETENGRVISYYINGRKVTKEQFDSYELL
jgi:hypothetical protein